MQKLLKLCMQASSKFSYSAILNVLDIFYVDFTYVYLIFQHHKIQQKCVLNLIPGQRAHSYKTCRCKLQLPRSQHITICTSHYQNTELQGGQRTRYTYSKEGRLQTPNSSSMSLKSQVTQKYINVTRSSDIYYKLVSSLFIAIIRF